MELAKSLADSLVRYALTITDERRRKDYLEYSAKWQSRNYRNTYISDAQSVYPIAMSTRSGLVGAFFLWKRSENDDII